MSEDQLVIDVHGINKHFGNKHVVKNVALQVKRGEIYGFLGPNGSGKTTTIRMLCGLLTPDSGSGSCLGYDIITQSHLIKLQVGYMTQKFSFYEDLSVAENLDFIAHLYGITKRKQKVADTLKQLGLYERRRQLTGTLSGGWKQRVALAACVLHNPALLLLDEPTSGVDPKARRSFWEQIHQLSQQGITTLISTHYMDEAERCTRLAYIRDGDLLIEGNIQQVIAQVGLTTWLIVGDKVQDLATTLKSLAGVEQIAIFGNKLQVSGKNAERLKTSLDNCAAVNNYQRTIIDATLEDSFISLVSQAERKTNES